METTRAVHTLDGVHTLRIKGWHGGVRRTGMRSSSGLLEIVVEKRHGGEYWTFAGPVEGVLSCRTSLLDSSRLLTSTNPTTNRPWMMTIYVPDARSDNLKIECV